MLATVLAMAAFHEWGAEPIKQAIAEATGMVDAQGQRRRVALMIGVTVRAPDGAASTAAPRPPSSIAASAPPSSPSASPPESSSAPPSALPPDQPGTTADDPLLDTRPHWTSRVMTALATFTLAGGFALPRWRREREELAALALEREVARADAARREAELRLSVLAAQVEPHFLFNTLAGVRSAIATDPARASQMIDRLTEYLRAAIPRLRSDGRAEATLGNQLDIVRAYLALMSARMPRLRFSIDVPTELLPLPFPPLMLISLAENAVKHGAEPKIGPVRIEVGAQRIGAGRLQVTMADDGAGFDATGDGGPAAGAGLGLANIRERLAQMYGDHAVLELRTRAGGGVIASITLPAEA
ncbi:MAG: histidine kinase [Rubrivivax sp.]|nr:histidine kinase [Rubrivivax sp.]